MKSKHLSNNPDEFEQQLANMRQRYELLSLPGAPACHLRFSGTFQGDTLIWDAHLQTLAYYVRNNVSPGQMVKQFIEVGDVGALGRHISIGLNLPVIDEPAILKTIIMIRQYKRLALGRHEFGELVQLPK